MSTTSFNRLEALDYLIRTKQTGSPTQLAEHLGISKRTLYNFIDIMKSLGAPIYYCKTRRSYCYTERGHFEMRFQKDKTAASVRLYSVRPK